MAALSQAAKNQVLRALMRYWSTIVDEETAFTEPVLAIAITDADNWIDTHEGNTSPDTIGYNGALDAATFRTQATAGQKNDTFIFVAARRRSVDILKKLFNEVD